MSILLGAASTIIQADAPKAGEAPISALQLGVFAGWTLMSILLIFVLKVFRRKSIVGPARLAPDDSAWVSILILFLAFSASLIVGRLVLTFAPADKNLQGLILNGVVPMMTVAIALLVMPLCKDQSQQQFGLNPRKIIPGFLAALVTIFVSLPLVYLTSSLTVYIIHLTGHSEPAPHELLQDLDSFKSVWLKAYVMGLAIIIAPLGEEFAFRGVLQTALSKMFEWIGDRNVTRIGSGARWLAVIVTAATFAAIHGVAAFFPALFVLALTLGYAYERTGNLWTTIFTHAMFNSIQIFLFLHPELLH